MYKCTSVRLSDTDIQVIRNAVDFAVSDELITKIEGYESLRHDIACCDKKHTARRLSKEWIRAFNDPQIGIIEVLDQVGVKRGLWR